MTWTKLGDEFAAEAAPLSDMAFRTHVEALMWSNHRLLDLVIPKRDLYRFAETAEPDKAAAELVDKEWWEDRGPVWWIGCRFPHWQRDRVQIDAQRKGWAERQRRSRRHKLGDHSLCLNDCPSRRDSRRDPVSVSESVSGDEEGRTTDRGAQAETRSGDRWLLPPREWER
jgi:hypothetical protein